MSHKWLLPRRTFLRGAGAALSLPMLDAMRPARPAFAAEGAGAGAISGPPVRFAALYFPVRFGLDMLRVSDARYLGLTPAQWGAALVTAALPLAAMRHRKVRFAMAGGVILVTAWACWSRS